jgi:hypothetical protein
MTVTFPATADFTTATARGAMPAAFRKPHDTVA